MELWHIAVIVAGQVFAAGAVYGAIRTDLRNLHEGVKIAHERIDKLFFERGNHA